MLADIDCETVKIPETVNVSWSNSGEAKETISDLPQGLTHGIIEYKNPAIIAPAIMNQHFAVDTNFGMKYFALKKLFD